MKALLLVLLLPTSLLAQHLRGGLMYTDVYNVPFVDGHLPKLRYTLGLSFDIDLPVWDPYFLRAETRYAEKGYRTQVNEGSVQRDFQLEFYYIYQTFAAAYKLTPKVTPYLGLEFGALVRTQLKSGNRYINIKGTYHPVDLGFLAGVQFFSNSPVSLDIRAATSVIPNLTYESFDDFGNPRGRIRGVNHLTLEVAAMIRMFKLRYQQ